MKAFLLVSKHGLNVLEGGTISPGSITCVVPANSPQEVAEIFGGRYLSVIDFRAQAREAVYFPKELFTYDSHRLLIYDKGPIHLRIDEDECCYAAEEDRWLSGTYLYIFEAPLFQASRVVT